MLQQFPIAIHWRRFTTTQDHPQQFRMRTKFKNGIFMALLIRFLLGLALCGGSVASATDFYVDPVSGAFTVTPSGLSPYIPYVPKRSTNLVDGFSITLGIPFYVANPPTILSDPAPPPGKAFCRLEPYP